MTFVVTAARRLRALIPVAAMWMCCSAATLPSGTDPAIESLLDAGHFKRARAILETRYKANPTDPVTTFLLSRVKMAYDDAVTAIPLAEKAVAGDANNADYHTNLAHVYGWLSGEPPAIKQLGYVRSLKKEVDTALSLNPKQIDALLIKAVFLSVAPGLVGGDKKQSEAIVQQMIQMVPERGYNAMGQIGKRLKQWNRAEEGFRKALQANPQSYQAAYELGMLYCHELPERRCDAQAEKLGKQLLQEAPNRIGGYTLLAQYYAAQQHWTDLDAIIAQAEKAVPDDLAPYYFAGDYLAYSGADLPRADRYLHKYLGTEREGDEPTQAMTHMSLGLMYDKGGHKQEAVSELQTAVKMQPNLEQARKELKRVQ